MTLPADADRLLATLRDGAWLDAQVFPPLSYAVPGLIPEGSVLLVGAPKIGKSWFVLTVALAVAEGGRALGIEVPKRPVLYLALEDGHRRLQDRCRRLLVGEKIPPEFQYLTMIEPGRVGDTIAAWINWHQEPPPLIILDTLGKVLPPALNNETTYQRDYRVGTALKRIVDTYPGATLLTNHHDRKANADDFVDAVSGTHGLAGAADTIIVLARNRQEAAGLVKVTGRDVAEGEYAATFKDGAVWELDGHDLEVAREKAQKVRATTRATAGAGDRMLDVVLYAYAHPEGVRRGDVAKALNMEPKAATVYLARAVDAGRLQRAERGLYTPVISVTSVTSEAADNTDNTDNTPPKGGAVKQDDLVPFAVADGLLARIAAERPGKLTETEHQHLLAVARENLAREAQVTLAAAGKTIIEAADRGAFTLQCGEQFAAVSIYGRLLVVYTRVELAGRCHPERN
jgi:AAA domain